MEAEIIQNHKGRKGVFIPMEEWEEMKAVYPEIESLNDNLQQWEKDFIDERLEAISRNSKRLLPIEGLFAELKRKI